MRAALNINPDIIVAGRLAIDGDTVLLSNNHTLYISRRRKKQVQASFNQFLLEKAKEE